VAATAFADEKRESPKQVTADRTLAFADMMTLKELRGEFSVVWKESRAGEVPPRELGGGFRCPPVTDCHRGCPPGGSVGVYNRRG
jgi:hypothetical protein